MGAAGGLEPRGVAEEASSERHLRAKLTRAGPLLVVWLLVAAWVNVPYLRAAASPPPGRVFAGTFHWLDDFYNYVSYVQQAEDGAFLFQNKLEPAPHSALLVNLEWWATGRLSAALGHRPFLAYRLFGVLASLALLAAAEAWLSRAGLPASHRLGALLLVATGGGLGGLIFELTHRPVGDSLDLSTGCFPFMGFLANPHFTAGTALLMWGLLAFERGSSWLGAALGTVLALVRPYDVVTLGAVRTLSVAAVEPPRRWLRLLLPLLGLLPALAYDVWVFFFAGPTFAGIRARYAFPPATLFVWALAPAAALAVFAPSPSRADPQGRARIHLWIWVGLGLAIILLRQEGFSGQLLVGLGAPLLILAALALARWPPAITAVVAVAFASTAVVATRIVLQPDPHWFPPRDLMEAAEALRPLCRPGDVLYAPPDISLYAIGRSACRAAVAHEAAHGFAERSAEMRSFYREATPETRRQVLDRLGITHLALPGDAGPEPVAWLGEGSGFRKAASVAGPASAITWYARDRAKGQHAP